MVRCIALADVLSFQHKIIRFYCIFIPRSVKEDLLSNGYEVRTITHDSEFLLDITPNKVVIIDGYQFTQEIESQIKARCDTLITIDDLHDRDYLADVIINHSPCASEENYFVGSSQKLFLGEQFSMLRRSFIEAAQRTPVKQAYIFVCVGGSDNRGLSLSIVRSILETKIKIPVKLIVGASFNHWNDLNDLILNSNGLIELLSALSEEEMCKVMSGADYGIVPASGIMLEAICCSCKLLTFWYANNQNELHDYMRSMYGTLSFGDNSTEFDTQKFKNQFRQISTLKRPLETAMKLKMGLSHENIKEQLAPLLV